MKCDRCYGTGTIQYISPWGKMPTNCPDCHGNGVEDCCHGHEGQPEEETNDGD